jgi:hypothetical protein
VARICRVLEGNAPYCRDRSAPHRGNRGERFYAYQIVGRRWTIWDAWYTGTDQDSGEGLIPDLDRVLDPRFNIANWYEESVGGRKTFPIRASLMMEMTRTAQIKMTGGVPELFLEEEPSYWENEMVSCRAQRPDDHDPKERR